MATTERVENCPVGREAGRRSGTTSCARWRPSVPASARWRPSGWASGSSSSAMSLRSPVVRDLDHLAALPLSSSAWSTVPRSRPALPASTGDLGQGQCGDPRAGGAGDGPDRGAAGGGLVRIDLLPNTELVRGRPRL